MNKCSCLLMFLLVASCGRGHNFEAYRNIYTDNKESFSALSSVSLDLSKSIDFRGFISEGYYKNTALFFEEKILKLDELGKKYDPYKEDITKISTLMTKANVENMQIGEKRNSIVFIIDGGGVLGGDWGLLYLKGQAIEVWNEATKFPPDIKYIDIINSPGWFAIMIP